MFYLQHNLPLFERVARFGAGVGVGVAIGYLDLSGWQMWAAGAGAVTLAGTALVGVCPACALLGRKLEKRA
ncbi:MAG: DUF2892 domain-containing protein [Chitinivorax sp.]